MSKAVPTVSAQECLQLLADGSARVIDVREQDEWDAGHIDGATLIPLTEFEDRFARELPDKEAYLLIHCRSGGRSETATRFLQEKGYTNVWNVEGGYEALQK